MIDFLKIHVKNLGASLGWHDRCMRRHVLLTIPLLFILILHAYLQSQLYLSGDVAYLLHAAQQLLSGQRYGYGIDETNPPLILYLYMPVILFTKISGIPILIAIRAYLVGCSLLICAIAYRLMQRILLSKPTSRQRIIFWIMTYTLWFCIWIFPMDQFGQRDYFTFIFILPYLLVTVLAMERQLTACWLTLLAGFLAGIGFAIKPYFIVTFVLIESYCLFKQGSWFAFARVEAAMAVLIIFLYLFSIFIFTPTYLTVLLPYVQVFYFYGTVIPLIDLLQNQLLLFVLAVVVAYGVLFYKTTLTNTLTAILWLATSGMLIAVIIPQTPWFYHLIPAAAFAMLLVSYYVGFFADDILLATRKLSLSCQMLYWFLFAAMVFIFYFTPLYVGLTLFQMNKKSHNPNRALIHFFKNHANESITCFSMRTTADCFPLIFLTHMQYTSRYPFFWWLGGLLRYQLTFNNHLPPALIARKMTLINNVANDLNHYQTQWIAINQFDFARVVDPHFSVTYYFSQNKQFVAAWRPYHYVTTIAGYRIYERRQ